MKWLLIVIAICLFGCKKSDNGQPAYTYTDIVVVNNLSYDLENVKVGIMNWDAGKATLIKDLGNLLHGATSNSFELTDKSATEVYLYFDYLSHTYMLTNGYAIKRPATITITIEGDAKGAEIEKSSAAYPK